MFFITSDKRSFKKPECSAIQQSSVRAHPYKCVVADLTSYLRKKIFSTVDPSVSKLFKKNGTLFDVKIRVQEWVKKIQKLKYFHFCVFLLYSVCFPPNPLSVIVLKVSFKISFSLQSPVNENASNMQLFHIRIQNFIFERFQQFEVQKDCQSHPEWTLLPRYLFYQIIRNITQVE